MREFCAEQARRIAERWAAVHAAQAAEPVRQTRVTEIVIRDSRRPMQTIRVVREPRGHAWGRGRISVNGVAIGGRPRGRTAIGKLLAEALA
jgi:hypothetical protein